MKPLPEFQELAITLFAQEIVPSFLTSKFLKESRIIPKEWEFERPPEINAQTGKATFTNDVVISARLGAVTFSENLHGKKLLDVKIPNIVDKWVKTLHKFDYQAIEIEPSSFFSFEKESTKLFRHYIPAVLLAPGDWHEGSLKPLRASLNLAYTSKKGEFIIKIEDVLLRENDNSFQPGAMFSGNFACELSGNTASQKRDRLYEFIKGWQEDLEIYRDIVNKKLLGLNNS
jgi:hypothetical protein